MMFLNRQNLFISIISGTISIASYLALEKLYYKLKNSHQIQSPSKIYEEKALVDQYLMFNYSDQQEMLLFDLNEYANVKNCFLFPKRVALLCKDYCPDIFFSDDAQSRSALDVGCAVGRSCFELSKLFNTVVGIDYSVNFIDNCNQILKEKVVNYECPLEGHLTQKLVAKLDPDVVFNTF